MDMFDICKLAKCQPTACYVATKEVVEIVVLFFRVTKRLHLFPRQQNGINGKNHPVISIS